MHKEIICGFVVFVVALTAQHRAAAAPGAAATWPAPFASPRKDRRPSLPGLLQSEEAFMNATAGVLHHDCAEGLWNYVDNLESTEVILARWSSAPLSLLVQLGVSVVVGGDATAFATYLSDMHGTNLGDPDACASLEDYTYFLLMSKQGFTPAIGLCLPKKCSVGDVHNLFAALEKKSPVPLLGFSKNYKVRDARFRFRIDGLGVFMVILTLLLAALVLVATLVDADASLKKFFFFPRNTTKKTTTAANGTSLPPPPPEGYAALPRQTGSSFSPVVTNKEEEEEEGSLLLCFSFFRTSSSFLSRRGGAFASLDGIRVLSMLWVVFGHTILWPLNGGPSYANLKAIIPNDQRTAMMSTWSGQLLPSAEFSVDTFFWLSGFLGAFFMLKVAHKARSKKKSGGGSWASAWIPASLLQRYLRLTPLYAFVVFWWWKVERLLGKGPIWSNQRNQFRQCSQWWWANFLYANNVVPFDTPGGCFGVSWYLPNDFQFFLMLPPLCMLHVTLGSKAVYGVTAALCLASVVFAWELAERKRLSFATFDQSTYMRDYYYRPWTRAPPYLVGVATAVLWRDLDAKRAAAKMAFAKDGRRRKNAEIAVVSLLPPSSSHFFSSSGIFFFGLGLLKNACFCTKKKTTATTQQSAVQSSPAASSLAVSLSEGTEDFSDEGSDEQPPSGTSLSVSGPPRPRPADDVDEEQRVAMFKKSEARLLLVVALSIAGATVFGSHKFLQEVPSSPKLWKNHFYLALSKPAWAVSLSILGILAFAGQGGAVASLLELPIFAPLAKLTYASYLVHPAVLDLAYKSRAGGQITFSVVWYVVTFLGVSALVTGLAFLLHLGLEAPLVSLEKILLRRNANPKPTRPRSHDGRTTPAQASVDAELL